MNGTRCLLVLTTALAASCTSIRGTERATASTNLTVATQYWFRGVPQSEELVAQPDATILLPLKDGQSASITTWGNFQLSNDAGDAAFADRNGGDFTELDVTGTYTRKVGDATVSAGVISYNFPNAVGVSTHEAFLGATWDGTCVSQTLTAYYDFDQADDFYLTYGLGHTWQLDEKFTGTLSGLLGYMGEDQAAFYFAEQDSGFSDASVTGMLNYAYDANTNVYAKATAITVPDSTLRDASEARDFKTSTVIFTVGIGWSL